VIARSRSASILVLVVIGTAFISSCSSRSPQPNQNATTNQSFVETPPFQTKEPAHYKAVRTITNVDSKGQSTTIKKTIARYDDLRREEGGNDSSQQIVILDTADWRVVMLPEAKIYSEVMGAEAALPSDQEIDNSPERLMHADTIATSYEKLGPESVLGRNATKYRAVVNGSPAENVSGSETLIWIDESLGMPIRSETKSNDGSRTIIELTDIVLDVDKSLFQIPAGYEKVAVDEFRRRLTKIKN